MNIVDDRFNADAVSAVANLLAEGDDHRSIAHLIEVLAVSDSLSVRQLIALNNVLDDWADHE